MGDRIPIVFVAAVLGLVGSPGDAQLIDCSGRMGDLTVFLDEPKVSQSLEATNLLDDLWFFLDQERERSWLETGDTSVAFAGCPGRRPRLDGADFREEVVSSLYNEGVLLELWSRLKNPAAPDEPPRWEAQLGFLSVPLRFQHFTEGSGPAGVHFQRYPRDPTAPAPEPLEVFRHVREIDILVAAGLGIREFRNQEHEHAQQHLCQARLLAQKLLAESHDDDLEEVADYVEELARRNLQLASQGASPDSALRTLLADRPSPCPEVEP